MLYGMAKKFKYMCVCVRARALRCVQLFVTPWTVAHQAPLSMEFSGQEYWSGFPRNLHDPGIKPTSCASPALAGAFFSIDTHYMKQSWLHHPSSWAGIAQHWEGTSPTRKSFPCRNRNSSVSDELLPRLLGTTQKLHFSFTPLKDWDV